MLELNKEGVRCFWREMTFRKRKVRYNVGTSWGKLRSRVYLEYPRVTQPSMTNRYGGLLVDTKGSDGTTSGSEIPSWGELRCRV